MGISVDIVLVDGTAEGLRTAGIGNWTGFLIAGPRDQMLAIKEMQEANYAGVYLLFGYEEGSLSTPSVYVGQAVNLVNRLAVHEKSSTSPKDFWESQILITTKDNSLGHSEITWLESELIRMINTDRVVISRNKNAPGAGTLKQGAKFIMTDFLHYVKILLPLLHARITNLASAPTATVEKPEDNASLRLHMNFKNASASCVFADGGYIIEEGSTCCQEEQRSCDSHVRKVRAGLVKRGILVPNPKNDSTLIFKAAHREKSPSAAAGIIAGGPMNGRLRWVLENTNVTLKEWQEKHDLAAASALPPVPQENGA